LAIHGKNARVYINEIDLSCYSNNISLDRSNDVVEKTTFCSNAKEYIDGLKDATSTIDGNYTDEINLSELGNQFNLLTYYPNLDSVGNKGYVMECLKTSMATSQSVTDKINFALSVNSNDGVKRIISICNRGLREEGIILSSVDLVTPKDTGSIYLHLISSNVEDEPIKVIVQHSNDDAIYSTLHEFDIDGSETFLKVDKTNINRYVRVSIVLDDILDNINLNVSIGGF
jgi:hypothetical protein